MVCTIIGNNKLNQIQINGYIMKPLTKRSPAIAGILSFIIGPIGYCYIGFNFFISGIIIWSIFSTIFIFIKYPLPNGTEYLQLLVYSYFGYELAIIRNILVYGREVQDNEKIFRSVKYGIYIMVKMLITVGQLYALYFGLYFTYISIVNGHIFIGILILLGSLLTIWVLKSIMGYLSTLIMKHFNIDSKWKSVKALSNYYKEIYKD
jgi:hypothetical protein